MSDQAESPIEYLFPAPYQGNAINLPLDTSTVACIVTSPPYNVGIEYPDYSDTLDWEDYVDMVTLSVSEMARVLIPGGRFWINVQAMVPELVGEANGPRVNLVDIWTGAIKAVSSRKKLYIRDYIVWLQGRHDGGTAWGSWTLPTAPNLRGAHEFIICGFKPEDRKQPRWPRSRPKVWKGWTDARENIGGDWTDLCLNVWEFPSARRRDDAPAPFPDELPARAIRLSTFPHEVVLDPFAGSGTTAKVANSLDRVGIGFDVDAEREWSGIGSVMKQFWQEESEGK